MGQAPTRDCLNEAYPPAESKRRDLELGEGEGLVSFLRRTGQCNVCSHGFPLLCGSAVSPANMSCKTRLDSSSEFTQETAQQTAARLALEQVKARPRGRIILHRGYGHFPWSRGPGASCICKHPRSHCNS